MSLKEELEHKLDTGEKKREKEDTITCTSSDHQQNVVITDQPVQMEETCHNNNQEKNETLDKEDAVAGPPLRCAYRRKGKAWRVSQVSKGSELHTGKRQVQASYNLFSQVTSRHQLVHLERQQRDIQISPATITGGSKEIKDGGEPDSRWQTYCTSTGNRTGTSNGHQQNVVIVNQPVEKTLHNNKQEEIDMLQDEDTSFRIHSDYFYERRKGKMRTSKCASDVCKQSKLDKGKRQAQASGVFSQVTSRLKARLEEQRREIKISPATITRVITPVETVSFKSSSKKGRGRKSKALTGRSSCSVPRQRKRKSGTLVQQDIEEIEDEELNNRRWSYLLGKNEKAPSIFDHSPKGFDLVNTHIGYQESLLNFAKNLGPTVQSLASKKLKQLSLAQTTAHAFEVPVPQQLSSTWRLSDNPKGKSVIMDGGCRRKSVSAGDMRPMRSFDRVGTPSAGSAYIASSPDASRIQRPADVVHKAVRGNVHFPTFNQNQLVLQQQQQHLPPSNAPVLNANTVRPGYQIPFAYEAQPTQSAYPSMTGRPSSLSTLCHASGSGYGVWSGHQSTPLNEVQRQANPASFGQGFQQTLNNSQMQLQNQVELEAHQQQRMGFEQQPLPILSNMFDTGTSSSVRNHPTTSDAGRNAQQLPLAHCTCTNLELQLRTKPLSPNEAS